MHTKLRGRVTELKGTLPDEVGDTDKQICSLPQRCEPEGIHHIVQGSSGQSSTKAGGRMGMEGYDERDPQPGRNRQGVYPVQDKVSV